MGFGAGDIPSLAATTRGQWWERSAVLGSYVLLFSPQHHPAGAVGAFRQLEERMETVRPAEQGRRVRGLLRSPRFARPRRICPPALWCAPMAQRRVHKGVGRSGPRRSRGGSSTKIHTKTDLDGHPIAFDLTDGEKVDAPPVPIRLDLGSEVEPRRRSATSATPARPTDRPHWTAASFLSFHTSQ